METAQAETAKSEAKPERDTIAKVRENLATVVDKTDTAIGELRTAIADQAEIANAAAAQQAATNEVILKFMERQSTRAIDNPVSMNTQRYEADEQDLGEVADIGESVIITGIFDINSPDFQNKAKILAFMEEKVTVHIHDSNSDQEVGIFCISVNNKKEHFRFGQTKTVRRYIIEGLARARPETYSNEEIVKHTPTGDVRVVVNRGSRGVRYPFSIERDINPIGQAWLKCIQRQN